jgi:hypothetical protein
MYCTVHAVVWEGGGSYGDFIFITRRDHCYHITPPSTISSTTTQKKRKKKKKRKKRKKRRRRVRSHAPSDSPNALSPQLSLDRHPLFHHLPPHPVRPSSPLAAISSFRDGTGHPLINHSRRSRTLKTPPPTPPASGSHGQDHALARRG